MEMSDHGFFWNFQNWNTTSSEYIFLLTIFSLLYRYTHCACERKMYSIALIYSQGCKCRGGIKCLWKCELMRGPLPWVLFHIQLMWKNLCDASYVTWKNRQYRRYHAIFFRKYKTYQKINILGSRFNSSGTSFFHFFLKCLKITEDILKLILEKCFNQQKTFQVSGLSQYYTIVSDFRAVGLLNRRTVATHPIFIHVADRCICLGHGTVTTSFIVLSVPWPDLPHRRRTL